LTAQDETPSKPRKGSPRGLNAVVCSRVHELQEDSRPPPSPSKSAAATPASRPSKSAGIGCAPASTWSLTSGRGYGRRPRGASGLLARGYKGKQADRLVTRIAPGMVSLVAELRGLERQAAEELDQMSQALNRQRAMVSPPKYSPPMPRPPTGDCSRMGVIGWSRIHRLRAAT
jgi:hypothetical protein